MTARNTEQAINASLAESTSTVRQSGLSLIVAIFIIGLVVPLFINIGTVKLTVYRVILIVLFFPALHRLFSGQAGRLRLPDFCVIGICIWSSISLALHHGVGPDMIEAIGILWIETLGAYLLGRCYIRTPEAFYATVRLLFWLVVIMLPFAVYEAVTGVAIIITLFSKIGATYPDHWMQERMNLDRVQGPFPHPIHFGVFVLSLVGVSYYVLGYNRPWATRVFRAVFIALTGALSLSSGPLVSVMSQVNLIVWDGMMKSVRQRWHILLGLSAVGFFVIDLISNRTPFHVITSYLAFNENTAYNRIRIWNWGTKSIFENPVFGIGLNEWERAWFMSTSVDMFWILPAMMYGVLVWILWLTLFFSIFLAVAYRPNLNERTSWYRTGYLLTVFGMFMVGWTVHFWTHTYVFFIFLLAAGVWFCDHEERTESSEQKPITPDRNTLGYSRFAPKAGTVKK